MSKERPEIVTDRHLLFLDNLRKSGKINMWGAGSYVAKQFGITQKEAGIITTYWMDTFSDRHPKMIQNDLYQWTTDK